MTTVSTHCDAIVIGAGFAGLASAISLARAGHRVEVVEKNATPGGRARKFEEAGFVFDMGPSWYWMPDVFERFFTAAGTSVEHHLDLIRLDPSYRTWFAEETLDLPAGPEAVGALFESIEPGAAGRLKAFLDEAQRKYALGMSRFVNKPGHSATEFLDLSVLPQVLGLSMFGSLSEHVRRYFADPRIIQILEFPVLFLGARAEQTPALYSLMNYADTALGTWYPQGGMHRVVEALVEVASSLGVEFRYGEPVERILVGGRAVKGVHAGGTDRKASTVVAAADYHHIEQQLLPKAWRRYDSRYWDSRVMSPSSVVFFLGLGCEVPELEHHNLFFDRPFGPHATTIYDVPAWPDEPLFYVCAPSRTDPSVAPEGCENLFVLAPVAPGLKDSPAAREAIFSNVMSRLESRVGRDLRTHVRVRRDYANADFEADYNSYRGNAYGLANTIRQTAFLKPKMRSRLKGLFFAGQLTTPGPGVPPSLISGQLAAAEASTYLTRLQAKGVLG